MFMMMFYFFLVIDDVLFIYALLCLNWGDYVLWCFVFWRSLLQEVGRISIRGKVLEQFLVLYVNSKYLNNESIYIYVFFLFSFFRIVLIEKGFWVLSLLFYRKKEWERSLGSSLMWPSQRWWFLIQILWLLILLVG